MGLGRRTRRRPLRGAEHAGQLRRRAAPRVVDRGDRRRIRKHVAGQLSGRVPRHARRARTPARGAGRLHRQHLQHRRDPPVPQHGAYGSSKWALRGLTQTAAAELAPSGIRVNAVFPGPIATTMLDETTQARLAAASMFGRIGRADEVADAVAFLVSGEASFITGSELIIDGGQCLQIR